MLLVLVLLLLLLLLLLFGGRGAFDMSEGQTAADWLRECL